MRLLFLAAAVAAVCFAAASEGQDDMDTALDNDAKRFNLDVRIGGVHVGASMGARFAHPYRVEMQARLARRATKREERLRRDAQAEREKRARLRARAAAQPRRPRVREGKLFQCAKPDCNNPRKCFNYKGTRIDSGRYRKAVLRDGMWWRRPGSPEAWVKCAWVARRPGCHPTNPTLVRVGGAWVRLPRSVTKNFVFRRKPCPAGRKGRKCRRAGPGTGRKVGGTWYRSATSSMVYRNCAWVREVPMLNCRDPTVTWFAGRWIKKARSETAGMRKVGGVWYLGPGRRFAYRNCKWVKGRRSEAKKLARKLAQVSARLAKDKAADRTWHRRLQGYAFQAAEAGKLTAKAVEEKLGLVRTSTMRKLVNRIVPTYAQKPEEDLIKFFMSKYLPHNPEKVKGPPQRALPNALRAAPVKLADNTEYVDEDPFSPEPNSRVMPKGRVILTSDAMLDPEDDPHERDRVDPEPGISGDYEPGAQFRNEGKSSHEQLRVIGDNGVLDMPQSDDPGPIFKSTKNPSLTGVN